MEKSGAINIYTCEKCGGRIVTMNVEDGVTPAFIQCRATLGCEGTMASAWYRVKEYVIPEWEWYRPQGSQLLKLRPDERDHVSRSGLLLRKIVAVEPEHQTIQLMPGVVAHVAPDVSEETLAALRMLAEAAMKQLGPGRP